jgi:hypothetical protein
MKIKISIDQFIENGGNIQKIESKHIELDNNLDTNAIDKQRHKIIPVSIQLGEVNNYGTQMYRVTYLKNDKETTKIVAGHLINVEVEVVLSENFK